MPDSFFDTNILVYLASADAAKADRAEATIAAGGTIGVQVLNEFTNVARRKMRMTWEETRDLLALLRGLLTVHPLTLAIHERGLALAERYGFALYDAMIAAAALDAGCDTLWSEDMQHGMRLQEGLQILDPFHDLHPPLLRPSRKQVLVEEGPEGELPLLPRGRFRRRPPPS